MFSLFPSRTPESSQMTPITPSSSLSGQHVPFSFSSPHDMATNGSPRSPRHSIASNSSGLSNPPSPGVASHLRDSRDSYESWVYWLQQWGGVILYQHHRKILNPGVSIYFLSLLRLSWKSVTLLWSFKNGHLPSNRRFSLFLNNRIYYLKNDRIGDYFLFVSSFFFVITNTYSNIPNVDFAFHIHLSSSFDIYQTAIVSVSNSRSTAMSDLLTPFLQFLRVVVLL